jgi:hypothetical protein
MSDPSPDLKKRIETAFMGRIEVRTCRRLQMATVLLAIVGILGIATAVSLAYDMSGEGLDGLLGDKEADVMGQVREADGHLVPDATVTYDKTGASSTTGITGWYFLEELETGKVVLTMEAQGYKTVIKTVQLQRGQYVIDFLAEPGTGTVEVEGDPIAQPADSKTGGRLLVIGIVICSAFAFIGALAAYLHRWYPLVLIGSVLGILTWGWFIGSALSLVSLVTIMPLRKEFGKRSNEREVPWKEPPPPSIPVPEDEVLDVDPMKVAGGQPEDSGGMPPGQ